MNAEILHALDLKCLRRAQILPVDDALAGDNMDVQPVLHLVFDYTKKDKKERRYVMEDMTNAEVGEDLKVAKLTGQQDMHVLVSPSRIPRSWNFP